MVSDHEDSACNDNCGEKDRYWEEGVRRAMLLLAHDIDDLIDRADALGLVGASVQLTESAELCRRGAQGAITF